MVAFHWGALWFYFPALKRFLRITSVSFSVFGIDVINLTDYYCYFYYLSFAIAALRKQAD